MSGLERPVPADWLTLRRGADAAAREPARSLLAPLADHYPADPTVHVLDLGAGTGANQEYLQPRLPFASVWTLLDHDADLLDHPAQGSGRRVLGGVEELPRLLAEVGAPALVTCSALVDLLSAEQLDALVDTLLGTGTPALLSLTVTGRVRLDPHHRFDLAVARAFDAHQARQTRPGPRAADHLAARARRAGAAVRAVATPWRLSGSDPAHGPLLDRYLRDRAAVAREQEPGLAGPAREWLAARLADRHRGELRVEVGHVDQLVLPVADRE